MPDVERIKAARAVWGRRLADANYAFMAAQKIFHDREQEIMKVLSHIEMCLPPEPVVLEDRTMAYVGPLAVYDPKLAEL